jgi:hypothetical protein
LAGVSLGLPTIQRDFDKESEQRTHSQLPASLLDSEEQAAKDFEHHEPYLRAEDPVKESEQCEATDKEAVVAAKNERPNNISVNNETNGLNGLLFFRKT